MSSQSKLFFFNLFVWFNYYNTFSELVNLITNDQNINYNI